MTTNQLKFQENAIKQMEADTHLAGLEEERRHNLSEESMKAQDLARKLRELDQKDREALAKYGTVAYASEGEGRGGVREIENLVPDLFEKFTNPLKIFFGGRK